MLDRNADHRNRSSELGLSSRLGTRLSALIVGCSSSWESSKGARIRAPKGWNKQNSNSTTVGHRPTRRRRNTSARRRSFATIRPARTARPQPLSTAIDQGRFAMQQSTPPPQPPPAGWYPDPEGSELRWWDGERWTQHQSERGTPFAKPTQTECDVYQGILRIIVVLALAAILIYAAAHITDKTDRIQAESEKLEVPTRIYEGP